MKEESCTEYIEQEARESHLKIWTQINADFSPDYYYVYQNWNWVQNKSDNTVPREFSFMGMYQKYCEADLYEVMRLQ